MTTNDVDTLNFDEVSIDSNMHLLYMHNNDHPGLILIATKLTGSENYSSWARSFSIALSAKNKTSIINGRFVEPAKNSSLFPLSERANDMIISWIFNVVTPEISNSMKFVRTARSVWNELHDIFDSINGHRVFQLEKELHRLEQGNNSVEIYYHKLKGLWDESAALDAVSICECPCTCEYGRAQEKRDEVKKLMQFLMGLHESFVNIRGQILVMKPLPKVSIAYGMVRQDESQRQGFIPQISEGSHIAANVKFNNQTYIPPQHRNQNQTHQPSTYTRAPFKKGIHCAHCSMEGHSKEECYKLIGYPVGHPIHSRPKGQRTGSFPKQQGHYGTSNNYSSGSKAMQVSQGQNDKSTIDNTSSSSTSSSQVSMEQLQT